VAQWHEYLARPPLLNCHILTKDGLAACKSSLVAQPFKNPNYGVLLLGMNRPVINQDLTDEIRQTLKFTAERSPLAPVRRRRRQHQHLIDRLAINPEITRSSTATHLVHQHAAANLLIKLHSLHPPPPQNRRGLSGLARF